MLRFPVIFVLTTLLVGCGSEGSHPGTAVVPPENRSMQMAKQASPDVTCGGTKGVRVHPCPVVLKATPYIVMSASGPGVVNEAWGEKSCKTICKFGIIKTNKYKVLPGRDCGTVSNLVMYGYNDVDQIVGKAYFQVTNDRCKHA